MAEERKGFWENLYINNIKVDSKWEIFPELIGEKSSDFFDNIEKNIPQTEGTPGWFKLSFDYSKK